MINYNIVSYCSQSYLPILEKTINNWLRFDNIDNIYIFTDFDYFYNNERVVRIKNFKSDYNFSVNCSRKVDSLWQLINYPNENLNNILLLDVDCLIINDISEIFNYDFDICVTHYGLPNEIKTTKNISSGFLALKKNPKSIRFVTDWLDQQCQGIIKRPCIDQSSLTKLIKQYSKNDQFKIGLVEAEIYNNHPWSSNRQDVDKWLEKIIQKKSEIKILHLCKGLIYSESILEFVHKNFGIDI